MSSVEIDGRLTSGLTAAEGANMPCTPQVFYEFFFPVFICRPPPHPQILLMQSIPGAAMLKGPQKLSRICSHRSLRNPVPVEMMRGIAGKATQSAAAVAPSMTPAAAENTGNIALYSVFANCFTSMMLSVSSIRC